MIIVFIGFGEVGGILVVDLVCEYVVIMWDCKFNGLE